VLSGVTVLGIGVAAYGIRRVIGVRAAARTSRQV